MGGQFCLLKTLNYNQLGRLMRKRETTPSEAYVTAHRSEAVSWFLPHRAGSPSSNEYYFYFSIGIPLSGLSCGVLGATKWTEPSVCIESGQRAQ